MSKSYLRDGIEYQTSNDRMKYHPDYHPNHGKPWTVQELIYLTTSWNGLKKADIAMALGRTHGTVLSKANDLRRSGEFEYYKNLANKMKSS